MSSGSNGISPEVPKELLGSKEVLVSQETNPLSPVIEELPKEVPLRVSYSLLSAFRNCRKYVYWKYVKGLFNPENITTAALTFGSNIHKALDIWHSLPVFSNIEKSLNESYPNKNQNPDDFDSFWHSYYLMKGYVAVYGQKDEFNVICLEKKFEAPILDVDIMQPIKGVALVGILDGLVEINGEYWLLEHKTAGKVDANYISKLWYDFQIILYCYYAEIVFGVRCKGVLYNILGKNKIVRDMGETEEEFALRQKLLREKNKSGVTKVKRKLPESDISYFQRLEEAYCEPNNFHREKIVIKKEHRKRVIDEICELTKVYISSIQRDKFYLNTDHCWKWGSPCAYLAICQSCDNPMIISNLYEQKERPLLMRLDLLEKESL